MVLDWSSLCDFRLSYPMYIFCFLFLSFYVSVSVFHSFSVFAPILYFFLHVLRSTLFLYLFSEKRRHAFVSFSVCLCVLFVALPFDLPGGVIYPFFASFRVCISKDAKSSQTANKHVATMPLSVVSSTNLWPLTNIKLRRAVGSIPHQLQPHHRQQPPRAPHVDTHCAILTAHTHTRIPAMARTQLAPPPAEITTVNLSRLLSRLEQKLPQPHNASHKALPGPVERRKIAAVSCEPPSPPQSLAPKPLMCAGVEPGICARAAAAAGNGVCDDQERRPAEEGSGGAGAEEGRD